MTTNEESPAPPLTAANARQVAQEWVETAGRHLPGFAGAWLAGSLAWLPDDALIPRWSDTDILIVLQGTNPPKLGKLLYNDVLLEVSFLEFDAVADAARLAADYRVSCSFVQGTLLADPTGRLAEVRASLASGFFRPQAIEERIHQVREASRSALTGEPSTSRSLPWQAMWVFPAGLPTHMPLLAIGENPTVRRRYEKVHAVFAQAGRSDLYDDLLAATGYGDLTHDDVLAFWEATATAFDRASPYSARATSFFASDISPVARPISIDGTFAAIEAGHHREALFWLVATQARSLAIIEEVAPEAIDDRLQENFLALLNRLGLATAGERAAKSAAIVALLPAIEEFSLGLIA